MSKKIAVYLNEAGETISLNESGTIKVFSKENAQWDAIEEMEFNTESAKGIQDVRERFKELVQVLDDCRVLIASKITGIPYNVLDSNGFNLWEMEGTPKEFLDYVLENENLDEKNIVLVADEAKKEVLPMETEKEGYYFIDLKELQESNSKLSSKQVLLPFLNNTNFFELEVVCSHMPPWFGKEFGRLNLSYDVVKKYSNEYKVRIYHKTCNR